MVYTLGFGASFTGINVQYTFQNDSRADLSLGITHRFTVEVSLSSFLHETGKDKP